MSLAYVCDRCGDTQPAGVGGLSGGFSISGGGLVLGGAPALPTGWASSVPATLCKPCTEAVRAFIAAGVTRPPASTQRSENVTTEPAEAGICCTHRPVGSGCGVQASHAVRLVGRDWAGHAACAEHLSAEVARLAAAAGTEGAA